MKSLDDIKPRSNDVKWKDSILKPEMPKKNEWYTYRMIGGIFSYAQHWVKYNNKDGKEIKFPVDCLAWDTDREEVSQKKVHECPGCLAGIKPGIKYLFNVIDREVQSRGASEYVRGFELPPTAMNKIIGLKSLNKVNGELKSMAHVEHGCDLSIRLVTANNKTDWEIQKGDRIALTPEELKKELYDFEAIYEPGDVTNARQSLVRAGYFKEEPVQRDAGHTSMPTSGAQMPPSSAQMPPKQQTQVAPAASQTEVVQQQTTQLPIIQQTVTGGLGRPPEANQGTDRPACFGGFLGNLDCPKCPHKPACLVLTQEREG